MRWIADAKLADAIVRAADEVIAGQHRDLRARAEAQRLTTGGPDGHPPAQLGAEAVAFAHVGARCSLRVYIGKTASFVDFTAK